MPLVDERSWPDLCTEALRIGSIEASKPRGYCKPIFIESYPGEFERFIRDAEHVADRLFNGEFDT